MDDVWLHLHLHISAFRSIQFRHVMSFQRQATFSLVTELLKAGDPKARFSIISFSDVASPEAILPFPLPFHPLLLLPSLSFSFSFRLLPFSSRILFPGVPSSYPKSSYVWGALWHHKFTTLHGQGTHCTAPQCSRGTVITNSEMLQFT